MAQNEDPSNDPRAYVLAEVGAVKRKTVRERNKKRDSNTERAHNCPKGTQIMGRAHLCLSLHLVSLWHKWAWRNGASKKVLQLVL